MHHLTDYIWLGQDRTIDDARVQKVARVFYALRRALSKLRDYYRGLLLTQPYRLRFFPLATSYTDPTTGTTISFTYECYLTAQDPSCVTFAAILDDVNRTKVVVKFVERYGEAAHKLLANHGFAPKLLYCGSVWPSGPERDDCGSRKMVVMERLEGLVAGEI